MIPLVVNEQATVPHQHITERKPVWVQTHINMHP